MGGPSGLQPCVRLPGVPGSSTPGAQHPPTSSRLPHSGARPGSAAPRAQRGQSPLPSTGSWLAGHPYFPMLKRLQRSRRHWVRVPARGAQSAAGTGCISEATERLFCKINAAKKPQTSHLRSELRLQQTPAGEETSAQGVRCFGQAPELVQELPAPPNHRPPGPQKYAVQYGFVQRL